MYNCVLQISHYFPGDFASVAFFVLRTRCPDKGTLSIADVNECLDNIALANSQRKRDDVRNNLRKLLRNTCAMEQKWLIRMIMKELKVGLNENSIFGVFHPDASDLFNVSSSLSKVSLYNLNVIIQSKLIDLLTVNHNNFSSITISSLIKIMHFCVLLKELTLFGA